MCLRLPETSRADHGQHTMFCVRKKTFAYYLDNHHNDGIVCVAFSASLWDQAQWMELDPERYVRPAYVGARGWTSLRLDRGKIDWKEVEIPASRGLFARGAEDTGSTCVQLTGNELGVTWNRMALHGRTLIPCVFDEEVGDVGREVGRRAVLSV